MTATQLNTELFRAMSENADDEGLMMKLLKYAKKLAAKKVDPTLMTKEELFTRVDEAKKGPLLPTGITMTNSLKAMSFQVDEQI